MDKKRGETGGFWKGRGKRHWGAREKEIPPGDKKVRRNGGRSVVK